MGKKNKNKIKNKKNNIKKENIEPIIVNNNIEKKESIRLNLFKTKMFYMFTFIIIGIIAFLLFYFVFSKLNKPSIYFDKDKKQIVKYSEFKNFNGKLIEVNESNYYAKNGYLYFLDNKSFQDFNLYFQYKNKTINTNKNGEKINSEEDKKDKNKYIKYNFFLGYDLENKSSNVKDFKYSVVVRYKYDKEGNIIEERNLNFLSKENKDYILNSDYNKINSTLKVSNDHRNKEPYIFIKIKYKKTINNLDLDQVKYIKICLSDDYKPLVKDINDKKIDEK